MRGVPECKRRSVDVVWAKCGCKFAKTWTSTHHHRPAIQPIPSCSIAKVGDQGGLRKCIILKHRIIWKYKPISKFILVFSTSSKDFHFPSRLFRQAQINLSPSSAENGWSSIRVHLYSHGFYDAQRSKICNVHIYFQAWTFEISWKHLYLQLRLKILKWLVWLI